MADMMRPPPTSPQPPPGGMNPVEANKSFLNPVDAAEKVQTGMLGPDTTIEDWLNQMGLAPQNNLKDLFAAVQKQQQNANPMNQMQNIAAAGPPPGGPSPSPGGMPGPSGPPGRPTAMPSAGLAGLRQRLGA